VPEPPEADSDLNQDILPAYALDNWFLSATNTVGLHRTARGFWLRNNCVVVPNSADLKHRILHAAHDAPSAGHPGIARTEEKVSRYYWWPSWKSDVVEHVRRCDSCQRHKPSNQAPAGTLQPLPVPTRRWGSVSMDTILAGLPTTRHGNNSLLVFVDRLTKMCHLVPCKDTLSAAQCAELFLNHVFKLHGMPYEFISDRGTMFNNAFWKHMCTALSIKQRLSSAFHCQN
jgi:hypothetical protein